MKRSTLIFAAWLAATALACGKKDEATSASGGTPSEKAAPAPAPPPPAPASPDAAAAGAEAAVPTEQDFEDQAQKEITEKNLEAEVKKLEKEIGE